jgi:hypothetical protein
VRHSMNQAEGTPQSPASRKLLNFNALRAFWPSHPTTLE